MKKKTSSECPLSLFNIMQYLVQYVGNRAHTARGMEVRSVVGLRG